MTSLEGKGARINDKFNGEVFNLLKFKLELGLASVDLGGIVDESKEASLSNVDPKIEKY